MPEDRLVRRVYSAEQLLRLRSTCSQPKLREAIEENDDQDAELIKEHVLRGSKSFTVRSFRSRTSGNYLRVPSFNKENLPIQSCESTHQSTTDSAPMSGSFLGEIPPNSQLLRGGAPKFRPSPTPSLKKKKAEAIVRAHGSPQHVRVTAGGRIVPSEQSPLCHPRYGYSAVKVNGGLIKFAPNHPTGKAQWTQATQNGFVAQDVEGRLCQIVNGTILPLNEVDGALRLYMPAPNLNVSSQGPSSLMYSTSVEHAGKLQPHGSQNKHDVLQEPSPTVQANALELEYSKIEHELKELDRTEVLHGRTMGKAARDVLFGKRRELVMTLDKVRKAIKSIQCAPPTDALSSPQATHTNLPSSLTRSRLPEFLQERMLRDSDHIPARIGAASMPTVLQPSCGPCFAPAPFQQLHYEFDPQQTHSNDSNFVMQPHGRGPPAYLAPPSFDSSTTCSYPQYRVTTREEASPEHRVSSGSGATAAPSKTSGLRQTDGASSLADLRMVVMPGQSRPLEIRAPTGIHVTAVKSSLNPMSPAYKPGSDVSQTARKSPSIAKRENQERAPLLPLQQLRPPLKETKSKSASTDTISPTKKTSHFHSSSTSSFETADFFPRNTQEYSTRKYTHPEHTDTTFEDKENVAPHSEHPPPPVNHAAETQIEVMLPSPRRNDSIVQSYSLSGKGQHGFADIEPTMPLVTSAPPDPSRKSLNGELISDLETEVIADHKVRSNEKNGIDRGLHDVSPEPKLTESHPDHDFPEACQPHNSSPPKQPKCLNSKLIQQIDFSDASVDWIEGYRAGLARRSISSDQDGSFLDGYCAGLLKSKSISERKEPSTGSPKKTSCHPTPTPSQTMYTPGGSRHCSIIEGTHDSADTFKEAVFAPHNETAILSPALDGPHADEPPFDLGGWARNHRQVAAHGYSDASPSNCAGYGFSQKDNNNGRPHEVSKQGGRSGDIGAIDPKLPASGPESAPMSASPTLSKISLPSNTSSNIDLHTDRFSSMTSIDAYIYRPWPVHRMISPNLERKCTNVVTHTAAVTSGVTQLDTASNQAPHMSSKLARRPEHHNGRFREGSIDGMDNPPNSPEPTPRSASTADGKNVIPDKTPKKASPAKSRCSSSPTKAKFEHIAEKVGIKVSYSGSGSRNSGKKEAGCSPGSPSSKRRWRDVWRTAARKESDDQQDDT